MTWCKWPVNSLCEFSESDDNFPTDLVVRKLDDGDWDWRRHGLHVNKIPWNVCLFLYVSTYQAEWNSKPNWIHLQTAAKRRCRKHMAETDEFISSNSESFLMDSITISTAYLKMKNLFINISNEIQADIKIHNQNILPRYWKFDSWKHWLINLPCIGEQKGSLVSMFNKTIMLASYTPLLLNHRDPSKKKKKKRETRQLALLLGCELTLAMIFLSKVSLFFLSIGF